VAPGPRGRTSASRVVEEWPGRLSCQDGLATTVLANGAQRTAVSSPVAISMSD